MSPSIPLDEAERLARLRELVILDSAPEAVFDQIAALASSVCGVPIALMSLIDTERQWFKANVGLPGVNETPRDVAFCAHAIGSDNLFEVPDASLDPRFADNPLVTGEPDIRFYAGAPLILPGGARIGTLCVIDREARRLTPEQAEMLHSLAAIATQALVMRQNLIQRSLAVRSEYEQALADSEARYRAIVEEQSELVSLARADGSLVYVNPSYARHFGRAPEQMIGHKLLDFVEPADRQSVSTQIADVWRTGEMRTGENRMVSADGQLRWVAWSNHLQLDQHGQRLLHSVGRDVTERKLAEQALRDSQSLLERTGRVAGVGGWQADLRSGIINWSTEARRIYEVDAEYVPVLGGAIGFFEPESQTLINAAIEAATQRGTPWDLELCMVTAKGHTIWVRSQGGAEFENGTAVRLVGAIQDISVRKRLERRLANGARFVRQITDSLPLRVAYIDKERRYQFVNQAHCVRFGLSRDEIIGHTRSELTQGVSDAALEPKFDAALAGQEQRFEYEEEVDGVWRRLESQLIPDVTASGEVRGFFATSIDITERARTEGALRELTEILENSTDYVVQTDWRGAVAYMNPAARRVTGQAPGQALTLKNFAEFMTPATQQHFNDIITPAVKANGVWVGATTVYGAHRRVVPVSHMVIAHRDASGRVARYSAVLRNISEDVKARQEMQRQAATLRSVAEAIPTILAVVGSDGCYRFVNSGFESWFGALREHIIGRSLLEVLGPADYERSKPWAERALARETVQFEREYLDRDSPRYLSVSYIPLWLDDGTVDGFVGVAQDITQHRQEAVRLLQLTQRDTLTGLLNRAGFEQQIDERMKAGEGATLALLYIDLDHFKPVNDRHGHLVGDQLLRLFAQRLSEIVRPTDAVARLGGDEFAILLGGVREAAHAESVADKVVATAQSAFDVDGRVLYIGASVGVAFGANPAVGWRDLVARADARLYQAKEAGRGQHAGMSRW
ncbi:MAG: PAS domain S-box protein [Rhizobacter sp.]|nr:PAS domain S-box protein [Rhizobacter sp.]